MVWYGIVWFNVPLDTLYIIILRLRTLTKKDKISQNPYSS